MSSGSLPGSRIRGPAQQPHDHRPGRADPRRGGLHRRADGAAPSPRPAGSFDLTHLQAYHRHIFGDVHDWAGELRTVAIGKGAPFCLPQHLRSQGDQLFARLARDGHLRGLDRDTFVEALAWLLAEIDALHPFREGNGRTRRAFLGRLARAAGNPVRWAAMDPAEDVEASRAAHLHGDFGPLRVMRDRLVAR